MLKKLGNMILSVGKNLTGFFRDTSQTAKEGIQIANENPEMANEKKNKFIEGQKEMSKRFSIIGSYYRACSSIFSFLASRSQKKANTANNEVNKEINNFSNRDAQGGDGSNFNPSNYVKSQKTAIKSQAMADKYKNLSNSYGLKATKTQMR